MVGENVSRLKGVSDLSCLVHSCLQDSNDITGLTVIPQIPIVFHSFCSCIDLSWLSSLWMLEGQHMTYQCRMRN